MEGNIIGHYEEDREDNEQTSFNHWLHLIVKEGFNICTMAELKKYTTELQAIFLQIVVKKDGEYFFNHKYNQIQIRSLIRQAFLPKRTFETKEEVEKYLCNCGNIVSCYNPNNDSWTTSGEFSILPIDREYVDKFKLYLYGKNF